MKIATVLRAAACDTAAVLWAARHAEEVDDLPVFYPYHALAVLPVPSVIHRLVDSSGRCMHFKLEKLGKAVDLADQSPEP